MAVAQVIVRVAERELVPEVVAPVQWIDPEVVVALPATGPVAAVRRIVRAEVAPAHDRPVAGVANGSAVTDRQRGAAGAELLAVTVAAEILPEPAATEEATAWGVVALAAEAAAAAEVVVAVEAGEDAEGKGSVD